VRPCAATLLEKITCPRISPAPNSAARHAPPARLGFDVHALADGESLARRHPHPAPSRPQGA
jgi:hypothetical protein